MCKKMPVILVNRVLDPKRWRAEEKERHKGSMIQKRTKMNATLVYPPTPKIKILFSSFTIRLGSTVPEHFAAG
jgi:hypothetical protein